MQRTRALQWTYTIVYYLGQIFTINENFSNQNKICEIYFTNAGNTLTKYRKIRSLSATREELLRRGIEVQPGKDAEPWLPRVVNASELQNTRHAND